MMTNLRLWSIAVLAIAAGCEQAIEPSTMPTRPVTIIELSEQDFARERTLTGVVGLYREENIGFEIDGRVTTVLNEGLEVRGPIATQWMSIAQCFAGGAVDPPKPGTRGPKS